MQTFVPLATTDYNQIAKVLDNKRLNKQALEGWQIMMTLFELDPAGNYRQAKGWRNHPAVKMWRGAEAELLRYVTAMTTEWELRGYKTTIASKANLTFATASKLNHIGSNYPTWVSDTELFADVASSHRLALLAKNYEWYKQFGWPEDTGTAPAGYDYVWPVSK